MFINHLGSKYSLQSMHIINRDQETYKNVTTYNLYRYAWFSQAQSRLRSYALFVTQVWVTFHKLQ